MHWLLMPVQHIRIFSCTSELSRVKRNRDRGIFSTLRWPADKSDGIGTTSRISQVTSCDVTIGAISYVTNPTVENVRNYFNASMTECINSIPGNRRQRALIYLGKKEKRKKKAEIRSNDRFQVRQRVFE